ncbi:MAG: Crp/Fnr family transcriptional regulator [Pseudohongiella sp.]|uniref:Crp/Fnr family transcriptional regulator n=1 Tax=Pseudohongiella sp. TaxID=1979412 RepID=UPI00349FE731
MATPMPLGTQWMHANHLLAALPADSMARLQPHLKFVHLRQGDVIYESGKEIQTVLFPTDAVISLTSVMPDGATAEISAVGSEGVLGVSLFMGSGRSTSRAVTLCAGGGFTLPRRILMTEFNLHGRLMRLLLYYTQALITQMAQIAACNRHHTIEQQLSRRLLMALDRVPGNRLMMTHEMIANMLGVRREGVTDAAGKLQKLGVIAYSRGKIDVLDRAALECQSCECYAVVKKETDRLLNHSCAA